MRERPAYAPWGRTASTLSRPLDPSISSRSSMARGPTRPAILLRVGDAGSRVTFRFCPTCGDTQCWEIEGMTDWLAVPVGLFADPGFPAPRRSVYEDRQHPWLEVNGLLHRVG